MPRSARKTASTNIYHVVVRGADRQRIFEEERDYRKYLEFLMDSREKFSFKLYAFCLMDNHVHLLIKLADASLETVFRQLNTRYAMWFNMKYKRTGFLQQGRYYSDPVNTRAYLKRVVRYIHRNPAKAGIEPAPGVFYPWSSYWDYVHENSGFTDVEYVKSLFDDMESFWAYHKMKEDDGDESLDIDKTRMRIPDDVARQIIEDECGCTSAADFQKLDVEKRNQYLVLLHEKGLSIRQLNRMTGISKGIIERNV